MAEPGDNPCEDDEYSNPLEVAASAGANKHINKFVLFEDNHRWLS